MKIGIAQINTTVADFKGNLAKVLKFADQAFSRGAELVLFPELTMCGYPPRDLLERHSFIADNKFALGALVEASKGFGKGRGVAVGFADVNKGKAGKPVFNSLALVAGGRIVAKHEKILLPTYDVFDEGRYFEPGRAPGVARFLGKKIGMTVCEDIWNDKQVWGHKVPYHNDPVNALGKKGVDIIINASASPFYSGKHPLRRKILSKISRKFRNTIVYCNLVGGNDELVFDGGSMAFSNGRLIAQAPRFVEDLRVIETPGEGAQAPGDMLPVDENIDALVLGTRDFVNKLGFNKVVLGLSGGIDSAVTATIAAIALGKERVVGILLPSRYSSRGSIDDSKDLASRLGIEHRIVPIDPVFSACLQTLEQAFAGLAEDVAEENIQSRIRGLILMALSNKFGWFLLATGNKSELSVGYCTLYGDMCGGLAVIGDVPKVRIYEMARRINENPGRWGLKVPPIPAASITKAPSAELKPNQTDQDTLPPYETLDAVLTAFIEENKPAAVIGRKGISAGLFDEIVNKMDRNEYKRRQAAPVLKVTPKSFGIGRRLPIVRGYT